MNVNKKITSNKVKPIEADKKLTDLRNSYKSNKKRVWYFVR